MQVFTTDADGPGRLPAPVAALRAFEGVPVRYFPRSRPYAVLGSHELARHLAAAVAQASVVHVHGLWNRVAWSAFRAARRAGVPWVLSPRGMLDRGSLAHHGWRKRLVYPLADRAGIRQASLIHATSAAEEEGIRAWYPEAPIAIVPNGVDPALGGDGISRVDLGLPEEGSLVVAVARLHPVKRLDLLVDAFAQVHERQPATRLVLAGPDEAGLWPALQARAGRHAGAVVWLGPVDADRRDALLRHASVFVLCSDSESFGMSLVEAMRAAVPVVVTDTCGWPAVASEGAGLVVAQRAGAIADGIAHLAALPDAGRSMGQAGRALVTRAYAWPAVAGRFLELYAEVARRGPSPA